MAKYVGKIFKVANPTLKIHGNDIHYVSVRWYNPFRHMFKCRVITSLEEQVPLSALKGNTSKVACSTYNEKTKNYSVLKKSKYKQLRNGSIEPIPVNKCENFEVWSAFSKTIYLSKKDLKLNNVSKMKIKK